MSASFHLKDGSSIVLDLLKNQSSVLLTIEGRVHGETLNCALIPLDRIDSLIILLGMVKQEAKQ